MANARVPSGRVCHTPRWRIKPNLVPRMLRAAIAPRQTTIFGRMRSSSASSQSRQARCSAGLGLRCRRDLPRRSNLKCLTALVTYRRLRSMLFQCAIEEFSCGPDEGQTGEVFRVPGLLADDQDACVGRAVTENRLCRRLPQIAAFAAGCRITQRIETVVDRDGCAPFRHDAFAHAFSGRRRRLAGSHAA